MYSIELFHLNIVIHYLKLILCILDSKTVFTRLESKMCIPSYQDFDTLDEAQTACVEDEKCIAVQDYYCDGLGFNLCQEGSITKPKTSNSCIYSKGMHVNV